MKYAEELRHGTSIGEWRQGIDVDRLRAERQEKARKGLRDHGFAAILAARPENTRYLTGLKGPEFQPALWYTLFPAEGDQIVFHHAGWIPIYPAEAPWIKEWRLARAWFTRGPGEEASRLEAERFAREIKQELVRMGIQNEKLAIVGFDGLASQALRDAGITVIDGWPMMLDITKTKTQDEIECLKMAFAATDAAWYRTWELLKPGAIDVDVSAEAMLAAHKAGIEDVPTGHLRSGSLTFDRGFAGTGRIISFGDLVYGSFCGAKYMGYNTCYYRTFSVGKEPDAKVKSWYSELVDRLNHGNTTADAAIHFPPASRWGYKEEAEVLTLEIGHGIGLYNYGYPIINRQWSLEHPMEFEVGMTLAIEGREGIPGEGGVRLEDAVVITENGAELIDRWPRDEILVAPHG
jgi:Xaa-Pro aminopeptidase